MSSHQLSDQQVDQELRKMTAFIKQEALEKAREITIKADEEFAIAKSKLVREETDAIDTSHASKLKQAAMSQQIARSTASNKTRLKVLGARQEVLDDIFEAAAARLSEASADDEKYQAILTALILEGFYALLESDIQIRSREQDNALVEKAIDEAAKTYKQEVGKDVSATILKSDPLPSESSGGVIILGNKGKIDIDNTFDARLELLRDSALPGIRKTVFGVNPNRKFFD